MNALPHTLAQKRCRFVGAILATFGGLASGCGTPFEVQETLTLTAPAAAGLIRIDNRVGRVEVVADSNLSEIQATVVKVGKGASLEEARRALSEINVRLSPAEGDPQVLMAEALHPGGSGQRQYEVQWKLTAPPSAELDVRNRVGVVTADGFQNGVTVVTNVGEIQLREVRGRVSARTDVGGIDATAAGEMELTTNVGGVQAKIGPENAADVRIRTQVGDVSVVVPGSRTGLFILDADVGEINLRAEDLNLSHIRTTTHHFEGVAGGLRTPRLDIVTGVGGITIQVSPTPD